jgi:hypothetical protein
MEQPPLDSYVLESRRWFRGQVSALVAGLGAFGTIAVQDIADVTGVDVTVGHSKAASASKLRFPAGTSKWNKIERRLFSHISTNWRGRPLLSHQTIVNLIASTRTRSG